MTARLPRHGYGGYTHGCRCAVCREGKAAYMAGRRAAARQRAREAGPGFVAERGRHGTRYTYEELGCRCDACRAVQNAAWMARFRARKEARR